MRRNLIASLALAAVSLGAAPSGVAPFLEQHCTACHNAESKTAGLDLSALPLAPEHPEALEQWARVRDRVRSGEMPPAPLPPPAPADAESFAARLDEALHQAAAERRGLLGRTFARRLSRFEYQNTVQDLLGIDVPLDDYLPEDARGEIYDTIATSQQMSHFLLEKYLAAADAALDAAFQRALEPAPEFRQDFELHDLARLGGGNNRMPRRREDDVVSWSTSLIYVGRMPATIAPETGWYRIRTRASAVNPDAYGRVWASLRSGVCYARAPLMYWIGSLELTPDPKDFEFTAWIRKGHMLELRPSDRTLDRPGYNPIREATWQETQAKGVPGAAIHALSMERIHRGAAPSEIRRILFGEDVDADQSRIRRQLVRFAARAYRRPVEAAEIEPYIRLADDHLAKTNDLHAALRTGYRALLVSPRFLFLPEKPGPLDDYQVASRLSYFLWSRPPDAELLDLASKARLRNPAVLRSQIDRLLSDARSEAFIRNFTDQWLDLRDVDFTQPDRILYSEFDDGLKNAMLAETRRYFRTLIEEDRPAREIVDSDWTYLDARLAKHYDLPFEGQGMQRTKLPADSPRGGLLTHGSVLKVTANGTATSPVVRGAWVTERILGREVPPPPPGVAAVEPDIRGAKTIREQLALHRSEASCAACHVKIDPPGFALESFDPAGAWRTHYAVVTGEKNNKRADGPPVDPSYEYPDGESFRDLEGFRARIADDPKELAANMAKQFLAYGAGARVTFADEHAVETIVASAEQNHYGIRSLLYAVVESQAFLSK